MKTDLYEAAFTKINAKAVSLGCALILICSGIYMCARGLSTTGSINLKLALVQGQIETGSLGLFAMFLGSFIVMLMNVRKPYAGQEVRILANGHEIIGKDLSYRKLAELLQSLPVAVVTNDNRSERKVTDS